MEVLMNFRFTPSEAGNPEGVGYLAHPYVRNKLGMRGREDDIFKYPFNINESNDSTDNDNN